MWDPEDKSSVRRDAPPKKSDEYMRIKEVSPEQVRAYQDCMHGLLFKAGLPYAALAHFATTWKENTGAQQQQQSQPQQPQPQQQTNGQRPRFPMKRALYFFGNVLFGTFMFSPLCYISSIEKHGLERKKRAELPDIPTTEKTQPTRLPDDYNYPLDLSSNLNEAESTFTSEFSPTKIIPNEEEVPKITPSTTYQDLRNKHRRSYDARLEPPPPPPPSDYPKTPVETLVDNEQTFSKREPRKFVKRNKYGDEIE